MSVAEPPDPVESPARRRLFVWLFLGAGGAVFASLSAALGALLLAPLRRGARLAFARVDLGPLDVFEATRSGKAGPREVVVERKVEDGYLTRKTKERVAVVRDEGAACGLVALSTTCTHLGCGVSWNEAKGAFLCPCHGGIYGRDGRVLGGPPPRPLARLPLVVEGGRVSLDLGGLEGA